MLYSAVRAILLLSALGLATIAPSFFPTDVTGIWKVNFKNEAASETFMVKLTQQDSSLTGHYLGYFDASQLAGTMNGKEVMFSYALDGTIVNHFGRIQGNKIVGSYHAGEFDQGDFSAIRVK